MSLMITGGGAPESLSAYESKNDKPTAEGSPSQDLHKAAAAVSPSISISPFGGFNISPSPDGKVTLTHSFFDLNVGPSWSKEILGSSADAHAGAHISGSGYLSISAKDDVCVGASLSESVGAGASATATAGPASGTIGKDGEKDLASADIQVCTGSGAGRDLVAATDGIAAGVTDGLRAMADSVPAIIGFDTHLRAGVDEVLQGAATAGAGTAAGPSIEETLARLLAFF